MSIVNLGYREVLNRFDGYLDYLEEIKKIEDKIEWEKAEREATQKRKNEKLKKLQELIRWADERNIREECIPRDIHKLQEMEILDLAGYGYRLKYLPDFIGELQNIKKVFLQRNFFSEFPSCLANLKNIEVLDIGCGIICRDNSKLAYLPDWIGDLKNLTYLNLSGLGLRELNPNICKLENLVFLGLSYNKLREIPECIGKLKKLEQITLLANELETLPRSLKNLDNLKGITLNTNFKLYIEENELKEFQEFIQKEYKSIPGRFFMKIIKKIRK